MQVSHMCNSTTQIAHGKWMNEFICIAYVKMDEKVEMNVFLCNTLHHHARVDAIHLARAPSAIAPAATTTAPTIVHVIYVKLVT